MAVDMNMNVLIVDDYKTMLAHHRKFAETAWL